MKKVAFTHHLTKYLDHILIDGQNIEFEYDKETKIYSAEYETEKDYVTIELDSFHPLLINGWWIQSMVTFLLTIFGIFEARNKQNYIYLYKSVVKLDTDLTYINLTGSLVGKVLEIKTSANVTEISNERYKHPEIKRRKRILVWSKIIATIVVIGIITGIIALIVTR